jgi:hypothetical protein
MSPGVKPERSTLSLKRRPRKGRSHSANPYSKEESLSPSSRKESHFNFNFWDDINRAVGVRAIAPIFVH